MARVFFVLLTLLVAGCTSIALPSYIPDKNPYKRRFGSDYATTVEATKSALTQMGWSIKEVDDPGIYERAWRLDKASIKHVLLMTNYEKSNYFVHSKNTVLNAYIREIADASCDVELRYLNVSTVPYKHFFQYRNDKLINQIYKRIEEKLQSGANQL